MQTVKKWTDIVDIYVNRWEQFCIWPFCFEDCNCNEIDLTQNNCWADIRIYDSEDATFINEIFTCRKNNFLWRDTDDLPEEWKVSFEFCAWKEWVVWVYDAATLPIWKYCYRVTTVCRVADDPDQQCVITHQKWKFIVEDPYKC